jgi:hypothetical protein
MEEALPTTIMKEELPTTLLGYQFSMPRGFPKI